MRLILICLLAAWAPATARGQAKVYTAFAGGGAALQFDPAATVGGSVILESVYGITRGINWEAPALLAIGKTTALSLGTGIEFVYYQTNHWRLNLGAGVAIHAPLDGTLVNHIGTGPFVESAVRWLFTWGVGLALGVHVLYLIEVSGPDHPQRLELYPTLALYQDFW